MCKRNVVNKFKPLIDEAAYSRKVVQKLSFPVVGIHPLLLTMAARSAQEE